MENKKEKILLTIIGILSILLITIIYKYHWASAIVEAKQELIQSSDDLEKLKIQWRTKESTLNTIRAEQSELNSKLELLNNQYSVTENEKLEIEWKIHSIREKIVK